MHTQTAGSLQTDTILDTHKDFKEEEDNSGSFLNETGSKQVQSDCQHHEMLTSKQKQSQSQSDANLLDYLNKCDHAISAIIEDGATFDENEEIKVCSQFNKKELTKSKEEVNFLDSLREEIMKEDNERLSKEMQTRVHHHHHEEKKITHSPATNSMPFELRDSFKSKLTESNHAIETSALTYKGK